MTALNAETSSAFDPRAICLGTQCKIVPYNPMLDHHVHGFADRMADQGDAHGRKLSEERKLSIINIAHEQFKVRLAYLKGVTGPDSIASITTTSEADTAQGRVMYLEDVVTAPQFRRQGLAYKLINSNLICAWESGLNGLAWETGRDNENARMLYLKLDPHFNTENLPSVWRLSKNQIGKLAQSESAHTRLAVPKDMKLINLTMEDQPDADFARMIETVKAQEYNGLEASSFIVISDKGSVAISSRTFSTFETTRRADARLYLSDNFEPEHVAQLVQGVSYEMSRRDKWLGASAHIEICYDPNAINLPSNYERRRMRKAEGALEKLGAEPLIHADTDMVAYSLIGQRYTEAVIRAVKELPEQPLSPSAFQRLKDSANSYGLGFGQAA